MDPLTQGALGASLPQSISPKKTLILVGLMGFLSGMAPDLDVFIRSSSDPLLFLEYHRQFTHSLLFIPIGGLVCATVFYFLLAKRADLTFKRTYLYCTLGYATHGLLDTCTSYGTQLLWPFTNHRFAWDTVSIIDPLVTLPLLLLVIAASIRRQPKLAIAAVLWVVCYQMLGAYQNHRVTNIVLELAQQRGHTPERMQAKPSFGNIILWKVIYEANGGFYSDGIRAGRTIRIYPGKRVTKLDIARDFPWLNPASQQANDLQRFTWFSQGYVAVDKNQPARVFDARYSLLPNEATGLWSIWLDPDATSTQHVQYRVDRQLNPASRKRFFTMLFTP